MNFAEGEEPVAVAAIFDEGRLKAGFDADDFREVDVSFEMPFGRCLDVEIFQSVTVQYHHAGLFRVGGVDQHALCHSVLNSGTPRHVRARSGAGRALAGG